MSPTADEGAATRRRLLAATVEVIAERGWGGVSTREVALRADANPGVVHYHFDSIDDLRRQAVTDALSSFFEALVDASTGRTPRQIIEATIREAIVMDNPTARLLFESVPPTARDPQMQAALGAMLARYRALLADRIRACHPQPAADPEALAALIAAVLDGLLLHLLADPDLDVAVVAQPLLLLLGPTTEDAGSQIHDLAGNAR